MLPRVTLPLLLTLAMGSGVAKATTLTAPALFDTTIYEESGSLSDGSGPGFYVGKTAQATPERRRALIEFDLSSIPPGSTITGASLTLTLTVSAQGTLAETVSLFEMLNGWGEAGSNSFVQGGKGAPAQSGDATWTYRFYADNTRKWTAPGGEGDYDPVASASKVVGAYNSSDPSKDIFTWSGAGLTGDVQEWVNTPASNFGWMIQGDETMIADARGFASSENSTVSLRPKLVVNYTIPEPSSAALVVTSAAVFLARRRR